MTRLEGYILEMFVIIQFGNCHLVLFLYTEVKYNNNNNNNNNKVDSYFV
jgi:hypothetical protein